MGLAPDVAACRRRSHLGGLPWSYTRVVNSSCQHHRGVWRAVDHMSVRTHRVQVLEAFLRLYAAEFGDIGGSVLRKFNAQGIGNSHGVDRCGEEIGPPGY